MVEGDYFIIIFFIYFLLFRTDLQGIRLQDIFFHFDTNNIRQMKYLICLFPLKLHHLISIDKFQYSVFFILILDGDPFTKSPIIAILL